MLALAHDVRAHAEMGDARLDNIITRSRDRSNQDCVEGRARLYQASGVPVGIRMFDYGQAGYALVIQDHVRGRGRWIVAGEVESNILEHRLNHLAKQKYLSSTPIKVYPPIDIGSASKRRDGLILDDFTSEGMWTAQLRSRLRPRLADARRKSIRFKDLVIKSVIESNLPEIRQVIFVIRITTHGRVSFKEEFVDQLAALLQNPLPGVADDHSNVATLWIMVEVTPERHPRLKDRLMFPHILTSGTRQQLSDLSISIDESTTTESRRNCARCCPTCTSWECPVRTRYRK
jgi:hypothetical protein